jgi:hypothetical protein|tara:strand:- start:1499 stop:1825 length:327 start_codon:yes stop_codon:yes gene_type:complete
MSGRNTELLESATKNIIDICNDIYTQIDRSTKDFDDMSDCDEQLVKLFNNLVDWNQRNLDSLYPDRHAGVPKYLRIKYSSEIEPFNSDVNGLDVWVEDTHNRHHVHMS